MHCTCMGEEKEEIKKVIKVQVTWFGPTDAVNATCATSHHKVNGFYRWLEYLTMKEQKGFKRELMYWPFPFSCVSYLNKNHAALFSLISSLQTSLLFSYCSPTQHKRVFWRSDLPFCLCFLFFLFFYLLLSVSSKLFPTQSHTSKPKHNFLKGSKAVYQGIRYSASLSGVR